MVALEETVEEEVAEFQEQQQSCELTTSGPAADGLIF